MNYTNTDSQNESNNKFQEGSADNQKSINIDDYSNNLKTQKQSIHQAEIQDGEEEGSADNILLALNEDGENGNRLEESYTFQVFEQMQRMHQEMIRNVKYCIDNGIIKTFEYSHKETIINFKVCGDKKTIEFGSDDRGKLGIVQYIEPNQWQIDCVNAYIHSEKGDICHKPFQDVGECVDMMIDLCVD